MTPLIVSFGLERGLYLLVLHVYSGIIELTWQIDQLCVQYGRRVCWLLLVVSDTFALTQLLYSYPRLKPNSSAEAA